MKKFINILLLLLNLSSLLSCIIFRNIFIYINVVTFLLLTFVILKDKYHMTANIIGTMWLLLCNFTAMVLMLFGANIFDIFNIQHIFFFTYGGLIAICLITQFFLKRYGKLRSHKKDDTI